MRGEGASVWWLDLLRVGAAFAVVNLHLAAEPVVFLQDRDSPLWHAANVVDSLSRWCIGVFIMVSGALLLDPTRRESVRAFFAKRGRRILVPIVVWSAAYLALTAALRTPLTPGEIGRLLWEGRPWYHMWYLFMIIGLYGVTPLLRVYIARTPTTLRWGVVALSLVAASAWDLHLSIEGRPLPTAVPVMFVPYLGYYLIGYELRRLAPVRISARWLWTAFAIGGLATIVGTDALFEAHGATRLGLYLYEYLSPNVILTSLALFCLASQVRGPEAGRDARRAAIARAVTWAAPLTLGIYLVHPLVILALRHVGLHPIATGSVFGVMLVALPAFAASLALTWTMSRIPGVRQAVGLTARLEKAR